MTEERVQPPDFAPITRHVSATDRTRLT